MFIKLISSKSIWTGVSLIGAGIALAVHGNIEAGLIGIGQGISTIAVTAKIVKYGN